MYVCNCLNILILHHFRISLLLLVYLEWVPLYTVDSLAVVHTDVL